MSEIENIIEALTVTSEANMGEVARDMLNPDLAIMHGEINNPEVENSIKLVIDYNQKFNVEKILDPVIGLWETIYKARILHSVPLKRKRAGEMERMFAPFLGAMGIQAQVKKGFWGGGRDR